MHPHRLQCKTLVQVPETASGRINAVLSVCNESQGVEVASAGQKLLDTAAAQSRGQRSDLREKVRRKGKQRGVGESHRFCGLGRLYSQEFHGVRGGFEGA